jgi:hypothetical protein
MASEFRSWTRQGSSSEAWERLTSATSMALACWWRSHPQHQADIRVAHPRRSTTCSRRQRALFSIGSYRTCKHSTRAYRN